MGRKLLGLNNAHEVLRPEFKQEAESGHTQAYLAASEEGAIDAWVAWGGVKEMVEECNKVKREVDAFSGL